MINCLIVRLLFELGLDYKKCVRILIKRSSGFRNYVKIGSVRW